MALEDGTFCYCTLEHDLPLRVYLTVAEQAQACPLITTAWAFWRLSR